ncbi:MAG: PQQ-binding-like beta-propeller repeat protein [Limisphaerales bacterium]
MVNNAVIAILLSVLAVESRAADWPQFLGPTRNGISAETNLSATWLAEGPPVVWKKKIGAGFSGPVVASNRLILFHRQTDKEIVECLDAKNGGPIWRFDYPTTYRDDFGFDEGPRATPTIADGRVYTFGAEGALHAVDFQSGKKIWNVDTKETFHAPKGFFGMACSPLIEGGLVIMNLGGSDGAGIVAFDKKTGAVRWKKTGHEASYSSPVAADVNGDRYAFIFTRDGLTVVRPADGNITCEFPWRSRMNASVNAATPLVLGDLVFLSASYGTGAVLLRVKDRTAEKVWSGDEILSNHYATSVLHDGFLYGIHGRTDPGLERPSLRCVELKTGKIRWSTEEIGPATLTFADSHLFILTEGGELLRAPASPKEFRITARAQILGSSTRAFPALANGLFYARSKNTLTCVRLSK